MQPTVDRPHTRQLASFALLCCALFLVALAALHVVRPDLPPGRHMVSEYGVGPWSWLMRTAFLALAGSCLALAFGGPSGVRRRAATAGRVLLAVGGAGAIFGGLFPMDPIDTAPAAASMAGRLPGLGFFLGVPGTVLGITLLSIAMTGDSAWPRHARRRLLAMTLLVWLALAVFAGSMVVFANQGARGLDVAIGWQNRALVLAWIGWISVASYHLRLRRG